MKVSLVISVFLLLGACTPFTFNESNKDMGFVALSLGVSSECQSRLGISAIYWQGVNVEGGRPFNLRNPWIAADYEDEFDSILYSFPTKAGVYEIKNITGGDEIVDRYKEGNQMVTKYKKGQIEPTRYIVEAGKINYLGNLVVTSKKPDCKGFEYKIIKNDQKKRDLADVAKNEPQLF